MAVLALVLQVLGAWTLAYHLVLVLHVPARWAVFPFFSLLLGAFAIVGRGRGAPRPAAVGTGRSSVALAMCAVATVAVALVALRPDDDDLSFFHRALVQLDHLDQPFMLGDSMHNLSGLPALSPLHVMTSYEPGVALLAAAVGVDPLGAYQNGAALLAAALLPLVYFLLYRHFRLSVPTAVGATWLALSFLVFEGNQHRSFGNVALVRLWQGKTILWTLFVPLTLLVSLRFLQRPSRWRFAIVALCAICAVGLSNSGVFMIPVLLFGVSVAYVLAFGCTRKRLTKAAWLNAAGFYCGVVAFGLASALISRPTDETVWMRAWPASWSENLSLVFGDSAAAFRNALVLTALPLVTLRGPLARLPPLLAVALCLIFANALLGPWWLEALRPASYWRLAYLFPLPWAFGLLAVPAFALVERRRVGAVPSLVAVVVVVAALWTYRAPALARGAFKAPWGYRFQQSELEFVRLVRPQLANRNVLASESMAVVVALLEPSVRLEAARRQETRHLFRNAGNPAEGERRVAAQQLVTTGVQSPHGGAALLRSLDGGVDAIIMPLKVAPVVQRVLHRSATHWQEGGRDENYVILIRQP